MNLIPVAISVATMTISASAAFKVFYSKETDLTVRLASLEIKLITRGSIMLFGTYRLEKGKNWTEESVRKAVVEEINEALPAALVSVYNASVQENEKVEEDEFKLKIEFDCDAYQRLIANVQKNERLTAVFSLYQEQMAFNVSITQQLSRMNTKLDNAHALLSPPQSFHWSLGGKTWRTLEFTPHN